MDQALCAAPADAAVLRGFGPTRRVEVPILSAVSGLVHLFTVKGAETRAALTEAAGRDLPLRTLRQVHGAVVRTAAASSPGDTASGDRPEGDALVLQGPGIAAGVFVADCLPVLICDPVARTAAAVHAGWRGTVAGVVGRAIEALCRLGSEPKRLAVAMGPAIGSCCFEVGEEVVTALVAAFPSAASAVQRTPRVLVDLVAANRLQAVEAGVPPERIQASGLCTLCRPDLLESYRRDRVSTGRMAAVIAWRE